MAEFVVVGPVTIAAAARSTADDGTIAARDMLWERAEYFATIVRDRPSQAAFILGWTRRLRELRETVLGRDQG